jgi:hypothetical protein
MKHLLYLTIFLFIAFACQKKGTQNTAKPNIFPKTSWKSAKDNKFPLYYQFTDSVTAMIRDDIGEIANTYEAVYKVIGDTMKIEVKTDVRGSGVMNGYKQTLFYKDTVLFLVSDKMPKDDAAIFYAIPDRFIKE